MSGARERKVAVRVSEMEETLRAAHGRFAPGQGRFGGEKADWWTALDELDRMEQEGKRAVVLEGAEVAQEMLDLDLVPERLARVIMGIVKAEFARYKGEWLRWIFEDGPNLMGMLKRVLLWAKKADPQLVWDMGVRDLGRLVGQSHGTVSALALRLFGEEFSEKPAEARAAMSRAQQGNKCRLGGKKARAAQAGVNRDDATGATGVLNHGRHGDDAATTREPQIAQICADGGGANGAKDFLDPEQT